jgi:glycosyltransferase involved in cell wall biosynthesis
MRRVSRIVVLGESMRAYLARQYGVDPARVAVIPNWATISAPVEDRGMEEHAEEFVVMYAGNLGRLHDFETVLDAAGLLQNEPAVRFVIAGDGARAAWLHREVGRRRLSNVRLRSFLPDGEFEALLRTASLGIVTLEPGMEPLGVPSKTYNLLAAGVPLLAITGDESEVARLIHSRHVGYRVTHGDAHGFAFIVSRLRRDREHWRALSANARAGAAEARVEIAAGRYAREIVGATAPAAG